MRSVTSGERGINDTMIVAVNAVGNHVPPVLIFAELHFKNHVLTAAPAVSIGGSKPAVWSNGRFFVDCLKRCIVRETSGKDDPILLIFGQI